MPSPSSAVDVVEKFKEQLQQLTLEEENGALSMALETLEKLESFPLTREILEITRIGATVNEIRKKSAAVWPEVSKRCRGLIKAWQRVAEVTAVSSCDGSSNGGTPSLVSPAFGARRGVTPKTPSSLKQQRISSTGLQYTSFPSSETSPSIRNGSYAPSATVIHKSASVGVTLYSLGGDPALTSIDVESQYSLDSLPNGSEASTFAAANRPGERTPIPTITLKRSRAAVADGVKTASGSKSGSGSPPIVYHAVSAARKAVQSTAQLVAQMSENLPDHIPAWDLAAIASQAQATTVVLTQEEITEVEVPVREKPASPLSPGEATTTETLTSLPLNGEAAALLSRKRKREESEEARRERVERKERKRLRAEKREQKKAAKLAKKPRLDGEGAVEGTSSQETEVQKPTPDAHLSNGHEPAAAAVLENGHVENGPIASSSAQPTAQPQPDITQTTPEIEVLPTPKQWYDHLIPAIVGKLEVAAQNGLRAATRASLTSSTTISAKRRQLTLLPYLDVGAPDFEEHHFPDRSRYIAERRPPLQSGKQ